MRQMTRGLMAAVLGIVSIFFVTGCTDVTQQVLDTIGLAGNIAGVWVQ
jgi:hypothetical protein